MQGLTSGPAIMHGFVRSAMLLAACILAVALLLMPIAVRQSGSGGPVGLAIAAAICLASGWLSELIAALLSRATPLAATLVGMMVRMLLPLGVCVALAATGQDGREHLAFIGYLLTFYIVTLVLETRLAVKRASSHSTSLRQTPR
jgi:hypothetical protein